MFIIKQFDTVPLLEAVLLQSSGLPAVLSGATVEFAMRSKDDDNLVIQGAATIVSASLGKVTYSWSSTDTQKWGAYLGEFIVTYPGGARESFPNSSYLEIHITRASTNAA